jgi:crotonobetainyl-CoA:carnitine CoA-transferase CaiB-like acyl-CoA transferase
MYAAGIQLQQTAFASYLGSGDLPFPCGSAAPYSAPNEAFPTADGWVVVAAYQPKRWNALCKILEVPQLENDERFATSELRVANREAMFESLSARTRHWNKAQLLDVLDAADIICGAVNTYAEVAASEPFDAMIDAFDHPESGRVRVVGPLNTGWTDAYRSAPTRPAPLLGEHTDEVIDLALSLSQLLQP